MTETVFCCALQNVQPRLIVLYFFFFFFLTSTRHYTFWWHNKINKRSYVFAYHILLFLSLEETNILNYLSSLLYKNLLRPRPINPFSPTGKKVLWSLKLASEFYFHDFFADYFLGKRRRIDFRP